METKKILGIVGIVIIVGVVITLIAIETTGQGILLNKNSKTYKIYRGQNKSFILEGDVYTLGVQDVINKEEAMVRLSASEEFDNSGPHRFRENIDKVSFGLVYVEVRRVKHGNYYESDNWANVKVTKVFGLG